MCGTSQRRFEVLFGNFAESQSKDFQEVIDEEEIGEDYGYLSDSDLEDDDDEKSTSPEKPTESKSIRAHTFNPTPVTQKTSCEEQEECIEKGKVVKIPDIAFVT